MSRGSSDGHLVERRAHDRRRQVVGADVLERALEGAPDRRAGGGDDDCLGHAGLLGAGGGARYRRPNAVRSGRRPGAEAGHRAGAATSWSPAASACGRVAGPDGPPARRGRPAAPGGRAGPAGPGPTAAAPCSPSTVSTTSPGSLGRDARGEADVLDAVAVGAAGSISTPRPCSAAGSSTSTTRGVALRARGGSGRRTTGWGHGRTPGRAGRRARRDAARLDHRDGLGAGPSGGWRRGRRCAAAAAAARPCRGRGRCRRRRRHPAARRVRDRPGRGRGRPPAAEPGG